MANPRRYNQDTPLAPGDGNKTPYQISSLFNTDNLPMMYFILNSINLDPLNTNGNLINYDPVHLNDINNRIARQRISLPVNPPNPPPRLDPNQIIINNIIGGRTNGSVRVYNRNIGNSEKAGSHTIEMMRSFTQFNNIQPLLQTITTIPAARTIVGQSINFFDYQGLGNHLRQYNTTEITVEHTGKPNIYYKWNFGIQHGANWYPLHVALHGNPGSISHIRILNIDNNVDLIFSRTGSSSENTDGNGVYTPANRGVINVTYTERKGIFIHASWTPIIEEIVCFLARELNFIDDILYRYHMIGFTSKNNLHYDSIVNLINIKYNQFPDTLYRINNNPYNNTSCYTSGYVNIPNSSLALPFNFRTYLDSFNQLKNRNDLIFYTRNINYYIGNGNIGANVPLINITNHPCSNPLNPGIIPQPFWINRTNDPAYDKYNLYTLNNNRYEYPYNILIHKFNINHKVLDYDVISDRTLKMISNYFNSLPNRRPKICIYIIGKTTDHPTYTNGLLFYSDIRPPQGYNCFGITNFNLNTSWKYPIIGQPPKFFHGGKYHKKYLKYKAKYLKLKNELENN